MSTINISNTKDRIAFGKLIVNSIYYGELPIIKVFLGDILIQDFTNAYNGWLLTAGNPSIYISYCWQDEEIWNDAKYWTENVQPILYDIF